MTIEIRPFQPADQARVKELIINGLVEHWKFLDPTKNPDLENIQKSYRTATFFVAEEYGRILGCGALVPRSPEKAEIVRMSIDSSRRRQGIGTIVLQHLIQVARKKGFTSIFLETTDTWEEVIAFYLRNGFHITHYLDGDVYFSMEL